MQIPPITLYDDKEALLALLKAFAYKEKALSSCALAEAEKLASLISFLEQVPAQQQPSPHDMHAIKKSVQSGYAAINTLQNTIHSSLNCFLEYLGLDTLYAFAASPPDLCCTIAAHGKGPISNPADIFYGGQAHLARLELSMKNGTITKCSVKYKVEHNKTGCHEVDSSITNPSLYFVGTPAKRPTKTKPNISVITGSTIQTAMRSVRLVHNPVFVAIMLWDYGGKVKKDQFRVVIYGQHPPVLLHDSGVIK